MIHPDAAGWTQAEWDRAYNNRAAVGDAEAIFARWRADAAAFRDNNSFADLTYGDQPRAQMQIFSPHRTPLGCVLFIHGGYWLNFDHRHFSHYAAGCLAHGWRVALVSYGLRPHTPFASMVTQLSAAVRLLDGPLTLVGHSAGGQLAALLALDEDLPIEQAIGLSGVYDLRPLQRLSMNTQLAITATEAAAFSPALLPPSERPFTAVVGGDELAAFAAQNQLLVDAWRLNGGAIEGRVEAGRQHFSILEDLRAPESWLVRRIVDGPR